MNRNMTVVVLVSIVLLSSIATYAFYQNSVPVGNGYSLTISAIGSGTTNPSVGTYTYNTSTSVSVLAITGYGYVFSYWLLNGVQDSANPLLVSVNNACTLVAVFTSITPATWTKNSFGETLQIDTQGHISLNGKRIIAVGFHLKHGTTNPSSAIANSMLQRLSTDGIRFVVFNFEGSENPSQVQTDIAFWMPLLQTYHMWVFLQVQHLKPEPPTLSVSAQLPRNQLVVNTINQNPAWANMVFAYSFAWELDIWFTDSQVTTYLSQMTPQIKSLLKGSAIGDVPILSKPCTPDNISGKVPMGIYADLIGLDYYFTVTTQGSGTYASIVYSREATLHNQYLSECGKAGYTIWHTEWGIQNGLLNKEITAPMFSQVLDEMGYHDCSALMVWLMWTPDSGSDAAFSASGTPTQWYLNICSIFKTVT